MDKGHFIDPATGEVLNAKGRPQDVKGRELPDPTPIAPPVGFRRQESLFDIQRRMMREHLAAEAHRLGRETEEEANDFADEDYDDMPLTPHEQWALEGDTPLESLLEKPSSEAAAAASPAPEPVEPTTPAAPKGAA